MDDAHASLVVSDTGAALRTRAADQLSLAVQACVASAVLEHKPVSTNHSNELMSNVY